MLGHNKNINAGETFTTMATVPTLLAMFQCSSCLGYVIGVQKGPPSKEVRPPHSYHIVVALNLFVWQTDVGDGFMNPLKHHELKELYRKSSSRATSWSPPAWSGWKSPFPVPLVFSDMSYFSSNSWLYYIVFQMVSLETQAGPRRVIFKWF